MDNRDAFIAKLKAQLDEWNADLDRWEARTRQSQANSQIAYNEQLTTLRQHRDDAQQRLTQAQQATGSAWDEMKLGLEEAWARVALAFTQARERFNQQKAA